MDKSYKEKIMNYDEFKSFIDKIHSMIVKDGIKFDCIIAVARGGLTLAHRLAIKLDLKNVTSISASSYDKGLKVSDVVISNKPVLDSDTKNILIVDDISDTGETFNTVVDIMKNTYPDRVFKTASLYAFKDTNHTPDYFCEETSDWIIFPWDL